MDEPRASPSPKNSHTSITTSSAQMNPMRMTLFDEYHKSRSPFNCFLSNRKGAGSKDGAQSRADLFSLECCRNVHRLLESGCFCLRGTNQLPRALHIRHHVADPPAMQHDLPVLSTRHLLRQFARHISDD